MGESFDNLAFGNQSVQKKINQNEISHYQNYFHPFVVRYRRNKQIYNENIWLDQVSNPGMHESKFLDPRMQGPLQL